MKQDVIRQFKARFDHHAEFVVKAPGRINLIGEHTDYNGGLVFPAAIEQSIIVAIASSEEDYSRVYSAAFNEELSINLNDPIEKESGWKNYILGSLSEWQKMGLKTRNFDCLILTDIPIGAGMSSSSALECGFLFSLNVLNEAGLDEWDLINLSQRSNHNFLGVKGGFMDQFACLMGRSNQAILLDCKMKSHSYSTVPRELELFLINTHVKHDHTVSGYNARAEECEVINYVIKERYPEKNFISDLNLHELAKLNLEESMYKRAYHVISENVRVRKFKEALDKCDLSALGQLALESHFSLRDNYEVSCSELDFLVDKANGLSFIYGARLMGGGFGGCTINFCKTGTSKAMFSELLQCYHEKFNRTCSIIAIKMSAGAELLEN